MSRLSSKPECVWYERAVGFGLVVAFMAGLFAAGWLISSNLFRSSPIPFP